MPVTWTFREAILMLRVCDVVTNREIESAFVEALANAPSLSGIRLLWDARESQTPSLPKTWSGGASSYRRWGSAAFSPVPRFSSGPTSRPYLEFGRLELWRGLLPVEGAASRTRRKRSPGSTADQVGGYGLPERARIGFAACGVE